MLFPCRPLSSFLLLEVLLHVGKSLEIKGGFREAWFGTSGVAKAGPGRARARPKHHVCLLMSRNLVQSVRETSVVRLPRASVQQVPGQYQ